MMGGWRRRQMLRAGGVLAAGGLFRPAPSLSGAFDGWNDGFEAGPVKHILPAVDHRRLLLKTSFHTRPAGPPVLLVNGRPIRGIAGDRHGRFWSFETAGLEADREYTLQLAAERRQALTGPWPLRTLPAPSAHRNRVRLLVYTCAGGLPDVTLPDGRRAYLPVGARQRLLARALSFRPDAIIANGDHIYWDQMGIFLRMEDRMRAYIQRIYERYGTLDRDAPVHGNANEDVLVRVADEQIADLYGTRLRSIPVWFLTDDHDYFENDDASEDLVTFPPDRFMLELARATRQLYYPEFLVDAGQPRNLPGTGSPDRRPGLSEFYGVLRYGTLLEALLYDTRRYATLQGPGAVLVHPAAEAWIRRRTRAEQEVHQLIHVPSHPFGWSAGKWMEWYPDRLDEAGALVGAGKPYWQSGWFAQHQRLLGSLSAQRERPAFVISGDLHMVAAGRLRQSGERNLSANPLTTVVAGPVGTGDAGWPSAARGTVPRAALAVEMDELASPAERNGFTLLDVTAERIDVRMFAWRPPEPLSAIDRLEPYQQFSVPRTS